MHSVACHQVTVENSENRLMGDDEEIILFTLKLEDDGFEADCQIMVGL